ncbi:amidohydrolase [uncultured Phascolarctobacterium sp.]|uniref:amidohydrolase n=1 Tax=uncultured Phascolarctobacterium sp. TaxID=512296 RepID=UPI0015AC59FA|nr:amidohydrolase [uncultured Phascolarctobacterium sp.]
MYMSKNFEVVADLKKFQDQKVTVYRAKKIVTMNTAMPWAECVAVADGTIIAVGDFTDMEAFFKTRAMTYQINDTFINDVIYPGFIEAHMHAQQSGLYNMNYAYVGYFDRHTADGEVSKGCHTPDEIIAKLREVFAKNAGKYDDQHWLSAFGIDPLILGDAKLENINSKWLDQVSSTIPICLNHASGHLMTVNSRAIALAGIDAVHDDNIGRYADGTCNGNVAEPEFLAYILKAGGMRIDGDAVEAAKNATRYVAKLAKHNGCTTIADKAFGFILTPKAIEGYTGVLQNETLPVRLVVEPFYSKNMAGPFNGWDGLQELRRQTESDRFIYNHAKLLADGSIQGYTANLLSKEYYSGAKNGKLIYSDDALCEMLQDCETHGYSASIHTNGNGATEQVLRVVQRLRDDNPTSIYRHTVEHVQLATENQLERLQALNIGANFFANHLYYWGDVHAEYTVGPYEVKRMEPMRSAINHGVRFGVHSDDPITEVNPLFSAWCACNRKSGISGKVYGEDQCLTADEAMHCITLDAAWLLHLEDRLGSIETGKWADFTVLAEEVTEANKATMKDIEIIGTVSGGVIQ